MLKTGIREHIMHQHKLLLRHLLRHFAHLTTLQPLVKKSAGLYCQMVCRNMLYTESYRLLNTPREYLLAKAIDTEDYIYSNILQTTIL